MSISNWITIGIFAILQVGGLFAAISMLRGRMDVAQARFDSIDKTITSMDKRIGQVVDEAKETRKELKADFEGLRTEVTRVGRDMATLSGKVNGIRSS